jgi:hypothetical protein
MACVEAAVGYVQISKLGTNIFVPPLSAGQLLR